MSSLFFEPPGGPREDFLFEIDPVLWSRAGKKRGKWYLGVVEAADCFHGEAPPGQGTERAAAPCSPGRHEQGQKGRKEEGGGGQPN